MVWCILRTFYQKDIDQSKKLLGELRLKQSCVMVQCISKTFRNCVEDDQLWCKFILLSLSMPYSPPGAKERFLLCHKWSSLSKKYQPLARAMGGIYFFTSFLLNWPTLKIPVNWLKIFEQFSVRNEELILVTNWDGNVTFSVFSFLLCKIFMLMPDFIILAFLPILVRILPHFCVNKAHGIELTLTLCLCDKKEFKPITHANYS